MPGAGRHAVIVTGAHLSCSEVVAVARRNHPVTLPQEAWDRAASAHALARDLSTRRAVYGRTTGVGANRVEAVAADDAGHGLRLLRSHASGAGPLEPPERVRATMVVRLNQLAAGGSGVAPEVLDTLAAALTEGAVPAVHRWGGIGTGDICTLAEVALALVGEVPWERGSTAPMVLSSTDALAFISSNATTAGEAVLAHHDLTELLAAAGVVTALSFVALGGAHEAYAAAVQEARPHAGQVEVAARLRALLGPVPTTASGRRLQDPYALRAVPQVHGTAVDALGRLGDVLTVEVNARAENPLVDVAGGEVWHNANFHAAYLAHALDGARSALPAVAELSAARIGRLVDPDFTGLPAFLAAGPSGSSGVMALEYVAQDAVAALHHAALPAGLGSAVLSRGLEEHASFATQAARLATDVVPALRSVLAAELVCAVRALALRDGLDGDHPLAVAYGRGRQELDPDTADRRLSADLEVAGRLLEGYATPGPA